MSTNSRTIISSFDVHDLWIFVSSILFEAQKLAINVLALFRALLPQPRHSFKLSSRARMTRNNVDDPSKRGKVSDSSSLLLRLPPAIRRQIYLEAGVITGQRIDLTVVYFSRRFFYNFLFVCRNIYAEISHVIYSENSFVVQSGDPRKNLQALRNLTTSSVSALTSLTVHLNGVPCCLYCCCGRYIDVSGIPCSNRGHKESLAKSIPIDQGVLEEWRRTVD